MEENTDFQKGFNIVGGVLAGITLYVAIIAAAAGLVYLIGKGVIAIIS